MAYSYLLIDQDEDAAAEELQLKPVGDSFERSQGGTIMFTCEVSYNKDDVDYNVKWFGDNNREISDTSGRSVVDVFAHLWIMIIDFIVENHAFNNIKCLCLVLVLATACHSLI